MKSQFSNVNQLCDIVRETSFDLHRYFRSGHLEKVYENSLVHRLRKHGIYVNQQHPLPVLGEDGTLVGDYFADLFVDHQLIVELKAARQVTREHVAQILGLFACFQNRKRTAHQLWIGEIVREEVCNDGVIAFSCIFVPSCGDLSHCPGLQPDRRGTPRSHRPKATERRLIENRTLSS